MHHTNVVRRNGVTLHGCYFELFVGFAQREVLLVGGVQMEGAQVEIGMETSFLSRFLKELPALLDVSLVASPPMKLDWVCLKYVRSLVV